MAVESVAGTEAERVVIDAGGREKPIAGSRGRSRVQKGLRWRQHEHRDTVDFARECVRRGERSAVSLGSLNINLVSPVDDDPSRLFIIALSSVVTA